jgi:hypothetical protein
MRYWIFLLLCLSIIGPAAAQTDGMNLPTDFYVLLNDGVVKRYGMGSAGEVQVTPDGEFVIDFGVAPDGERIAYRTETGLHLLNMTSNEAALLDGTAGVPPMRGRGETVVWSPQNDAIAYTTFNGARVWFEGETFPFNIEQPGLIGVNWSPEGRFLLAQAGDNIWWVYRRDANSIILASVITASVGTSWISDHELAFAPPEGGLILMDLDAANTQIPLFDNTSDYRLPFLSPEGRLMFFRREKNDSTVPEGYGLLGALPRGVREVDVLGTSAIDLSGDLRWAPGGQLMIALQGGVLALFDPKTGQGLTLPIANPVDYGWGPYPPPNAQVAATPTPAAIFPDQFPTLNPSTEIPLVTPMMVEITPEATVETE